MARKPRPTVGDYMIQALSPALIIAMIASLVFFLLVILYQGREEGSVKWTLFFFVFASVLVARISMNADIAERSSLYGLVLGIVTWVALLQYSVSNTGDWDWAINLLLIGIIWWCSQRLTWDCTYLEEQTGTDGKGVLEAAGLAEPPASEQEKAEAEEKPASWLERYRKYCEERRKKRAPGVWVVYFSLAALPLFGLGQALIPIEEEARRGSAFRLLVIYVGSGLGLLMTTAFLGLRNYLRQRRIQMPVKIAVTWLSIGTVIILLVLGGAALLPRPALTSSRAAQQGGQESEEQESGGEQERGREGDKEKGREGDKEKGRQGDKGSDGKGGKGDGGKEGEGKGKGEDQQKESERSEESASSGSVWRTLGKVLKWVVFAVGIVLTVVLVGRHFLRFLANFSDWAKNFLDAWRRFWEGLLGRGDSVPEEELTEESIVPERTVPFSAFSNPFENGRAERMSMRELASYTFAAFEAWARERDLPREPGQTPFEHVAWVGEEYPELTRDLRRLAAVHGKAIYGQGNMGSSARQALEVVWRKLGATGKRTVEV